VFQLSDLRGISRLEGVKEGASGDMCLECAQTQTFKNFGNVIKINIGR